MLLTTFQVLVLPQGDKGFIVYLVNTSLTLVDSIIHIYSCILLVLLISWSPKDLASSSLQTIVCICTLLNKKVH